MHRGISSESILQVEIGSEKRGIIIDIEDVQYAEDGCTRGNIKGVGDVAAGSSRHLANLSIG